MAKQQMGANKTPLASFDRAGLCRAFLCLATAAKAAAAFNSAAAVCRQRCRGQSVGRRRRSVCEAEGAQLTCSLCITTMRIATTAYEMEHATSHRAAAPHSIAAAVLTVQLPPTLPRESAVELSDHSDLNGERQPANASGTKSPYLLYQEAAVERLATVVSSRASPHRSVGYAASPSARASRSSECSRSVGRISDAYAMQRESAAL
jgi:hypothetical protein